MVEIWKDIQGYEGLYQVSNFGRVKSLSLKKYDRLGRTFARHEKIIKPYNMKFGYKRIRLTKNNASKHWLVHRLVALAFIPNPNNLPFINHKDENPSNNMADNLEWCTAKYNSNYGTCKKRASQTKEMNGKGYKPVAQYTLNGQFVKMWPSVSIAEREYHTRGISGCVLGRAKQALGFVLIRPPMTFEDWLNLGVSKRKNKKEPVYQYDLEGNFISQYESSSEASRRTGVNECSIRNCRRGTQTTAGDYIWTSFRTPSENNKLPRVIGRNHNAKSIIQYNAQMELVFVYDSMADAIRKTGVNRHVITDCCRRRRDFYKNMTWRYKFDDPMNKKTDDD